MENQKAEPNLSLWISRPGGPHHTMGGKIPAAVDNRPSTDKNGGPIQLWLPVSSLGTVHKGCQYHCKVQSRAHQHILPPCYTTETQALILVMLVLVLVLSGLNSRGHIDSQRAVFLSHINSFVSMSSMSVLSRVQPPEWVIVVQRGASRGGRGAGLLDAWVLGG